MGTCQEGQVWTHGCGGREIGSKGREDGGGGENGNKRNVRGGGGQGNEGEDEAR